MGATGANRVVLHRWHIDDGQFRVRELRGFLLVIRLVALVDEGDHQGHRLRFDRLLEARGRKLGSFGFGVGNPHRGRPVVAMLLIGRYILALTRAQWPWGAAHLARVGYLSALLRSGVVGGRVRRLRIDGRRGATLIAESGARPQVFSAVTAPHSRQLLIYSTLYAVAPSGVVRRDRLTARAAADLPRHHSRRA